MPTTVPDNYFIALASKAAALGCVTLQGCNVGTTHPFVPSNSKSFACYWFAVAYAFHQAVTNYRMSVFTCGKMRTALTYQITTQEA